MAYPYDNVPNQANPYGYATYPRAVGYSGQNAAQQLAPDDRPTSLMMRYRPPPSMAMQQAQNIDPNRLPQGMPPGFNPQQPQMMRPMAPPMSANPGFMGMPPQAQYAKRLGQNASMEQIQNRLGNEDITNRARNRLENMYATRLGQSVAGVPEPSAMPMNGGQMVTTPEAAPGNRAEPAPVMMNQPRRRPRGRITFGPQGGTTSRPKTMA